MKRINNIYITSQVYPQDIKKLKEKYNIGVIINNRPDNEENNQPNSEQIKSECEKYKIKYYYQPIISYSQITKKDRLEFQKIIQENTNETILAFCRTGRRSERLML